MGLKLKAALVICSLLVMGAIVGCAGSTVSPTGVIIPTTQSLETAQATINDAQFGLDIVEAAVTVADAGGAVKNTSTLQKQDADFDAVQTAINAGQAQVNSGVFNPLTFATSLAQAMAVYRADLAGAKAASGSTTSVLPLPPTTAP